jgi:flavin reductase (DIM6/NTAB) family NADH-FMN oxidoreductase RutF
MSVAEVPPDHDEETRAFKNAMRHLAAAVSVVTTGRGESRTGFTATSVTSLSMDPPALLVCLNRQSSVSATLHEHSAFCINVLAADQLHIAEHFTGRDGSRGAARYRDASWQEMPSGALGNQNALALIDCELEEAIVRHSHTILIGRPKAVMVRNRSEPLLYWHGAYRLLSSLDRVLTRA